MIKFLEEYYKMQKQNSIHLPKILNKQRYATLHSSTSRQTLQGYLNQLKLQQLVLKNKQTSRQRSYQNVNKSIKICKQIVIKRQKKSILLDEQDCQIQSQVIPTIYINKITTDWKPTNRYKTAMGIHNGNIIIYGGLGCQKNISWAKFSLKNMEWSMLTQNQNIQTSIYGHSLRIFKGNAYIFGGTRLQNSTNDLTMVCMATMSNIQLPAAPYRRKQHATTIISKYLVVHGGLQGTSLTKNTLFYFDIQNNKWFVPLQLQLPYLSHHSMATVPYKNRRRFIALQDMLGQSIYMFGGLNQHSQQSDKLWCLKVKEGGEIAAEEIITYAGPSARHSHCMQFLQPSYLCVYGGRNNEQLSGPNKKEGVYNDIHLFNTDTKEWIVPKLNFTPEFRYGAGCCSSKDTIFIFGGNNICEYADGGIITFSFAQDDNNEKKMKKQKIY